MVGGVDVGSGVLDGKGVFVGGAGVGVNEGGSVAVRVGEGPGVREGTGVSEGIGVLDGVAVGGRTGVAVKRASAGYSCNMAEYQSRPSVRANSVKRAPG